MYSAQQFEQAIDVVVEFRTKLSATVEQMRTTSETCVANMEEDVIATHASENLIEVLDRIKEILDTQVASLISNLEAEKERAILIAQYNDD